MIQKSVTLIFFILVVSSPLMAEEFSISFEWGDIPRCNTGWPTSVLNPIFMLSNVPKGTKYLKFEMVDLEVPTWNHGGGSVEYTGQKIIRPGAFKYGGPCPPGGPSRYEWTVKAKNKAGFFSKTLGIAKAVRYYP